MLRGARSQRKTTLVNRQYAKPLLRPLRMAGFGPGVPTVWELSSPAVVGTGPEVESQVAERGLVNYKHFVNVRGG